MKTLNQALIWIDQQNNKSLDMDGKYGAQCIDLIWFFQRFLGVPITWTKSARELWDKEWQDCRKTDKPQRGAVVIWDGGVGKGFGHAGLVREVFADGTFKSLDQNYYNFNLERGAPAAFVRHSMQNVLGFIVPDFPVDPAAPQPARPPASQPGRYRIKPNDNFWALETKYGWPHGTLQKLNPGLDPRKLQIGQVVNVPNGSQPQSASQPKKSARPQLVIVRGDTFWELETKHGWPHGTLQKLNPGLDPRKLQIGQNINRPA